jgi:hypothetical protein
MSCKPRVRFSSPNLDQPGRFGGRFFSLLASLAHRARQASAAFFASAHAAVFDHASEIARNVERAAKGAKLIVAVLNELTVATGQTQQSTQVVLTASEAVDNAASNLRQQVEDFLAKVAI